MISGMTPGQIVHFTMPMTDTQASEYRDPTWRRGETLPAMITQIHDVSTGVVSLKIFLVSGGYLNRHQVPFCETSREGFWNRAPIGHAFPDENCFVDKSFVDTRNQETI